MASFATSIFQTARRLFGSKRTIVARFHEHLEPMRRSGQFEGPLEDALEAVGLGSVVGGGTALDRARGTIKYADIVIEVKDVERGLALVATTLEEAGALEGTELLVDDAVVRRIGTRECLAIFFQVAHMSDEEYSNYDFRSVIDAIEAAAGPDSHASGQQTPEEAGLFFHGADAEAMFARVEPVLRGMPVAQNARVVIRHGRPSRPSREVRMPAA